MKRGSPLNYKQELFCREYLKDVNGRQAAIRAGYSKNGAEVQASRLLTHANILARIKSLTDKIHAKVEITAEQVLRELKCVGMVDIAQIFGEDGQLLPLSQIPEDARRAIAGIETMEVECLTGDQPTVGKARKVRLHDKLRALELLGRHLKLFGAEIASVNFTLVQIREELLGMITDPPVSLPHTTASDGNDSGASK